jgi:hypothetical protein
MSWTIPCPRDRERKSERSVNVPCGSDLRWRFVCWRRCAASVAMESALQQKGPRVRTRGPFQTGSFGVGASLRSRPTTCLFYQQTNAVSQRLVPVISANARKMLAAESGTRWCAVELFSYARVAAGRARRAKSRKGAPDARPSARSAFSCVPRCWQAGKVRRRIGLAGLPTGLCNCTTGAKNRRSCQKLDRSDLENR